jgi:hypothetical protein
MRMPPSFALPNRYLVHCTRARDGAWPDQSMADYFDEAIRLEWHRPSEPVESLARILTGQRLIATNHLRRGTLRTVCFSGRRLSELLAMRRFQSHLARWDWEPYGMAIRCDRLVSLGAQRVEYLSESSRKRLTADQSAFSQPLPERDGDRDWRDEQEWRVLGDVRLHRLGCEHAFVFVPSIRDARLLAPLSRWPIVVLDLP